MSRKKRSKQALRIEEAVVIEHHQEGYDGWRVGTRATITRQGDAGQGECDGRPVGEIRE